MLELNKIYQGDCLEVMKQIDDKSIDLTVTSPPYDNLRDYNGYTFDLEGIAKEIFRITKDGGVVVWIVGDATVKGSETGTSFKHALYFKEIGFNLHDTMIWNKPNAMPQVDKSRFCQSFEYIFVLSKGKPKTANPLLVPTKNAGKIIKRVSTNTDNINKKTRVDKTKPLKIASNVYDLFVGTKSYGHPAIFPEKLANDHIISWSNKGDTVFDPFMGSGTTAKMAILNGRNYIGAEISQEYCDIARQRIADTIAQPKLI